MTLSQPAAPDQLAPAPALFACWVAPKTCLVWSIACTESLDCFSLSIVPPPSVPAMSRSLSVVFFSCGEEGHMRSSCPKRGRTSSAPRGPARSGARSVRDATHPHSVPPPSSSSSHSLNRRWPLTWRRRWSLSLLPPIFPLPWTLWLCVFFMCFAFFSMSPSFCGEGRVVCLPPCVLIVRVRVMVSFDSLSFSVRLRGRFVGFAQDDFCWPVAEFCPCLGRLIVYFRRWGRVPIVRCKWFFFSSTALRSWCFLLGLDL